MPRSGALGFRNNKIAPLLSPAQQRIVAVNQSQAFSPGSSPEPSTIELEKERSKITRFLKTKERSGQMFQARESRIETRLKELEKKQKEFEKKKQRERKQAMAKLQEKHEEWSERRNKVIEHRQEMENKAFSHYRKAVKASKRRMEEAMKTQTV